jgi:hypothetical protein
VSNYFPTTFGNSDYNSGAVAATSFTGDLTTGSNVITNVSSTAGITVGMTINGPFGSPNFTEAKVLVIGSGILTVSEYAAGTITTAPFEFFNQQDALLAYTTPSKTPSSAGNGNLGPYAVSLTSASHGSRQFVIDTSFEPYRREAFRHKTIAAQRQSIMMTNISGQGTVNTEGLWRREQTDWGMGAGQQYLDRKTDSQETRFYQSKGVDVFSYPLQATLLPDTYRKDSISSVNNNIMLSRCGDYICIINGSDVIRVQATRTWSAPTTLTYDTATYGGTAPSNVYDITSNDTYVFTATNTGIWFCEVGSSTVFKLFAANDTTSGYTTGYSMVGSVNDQLVAAKGNRLYAFQPRSTTGYPVFGSPPSISDILSNVTQIVGDGTTATVTTDKPHGLSIGQPVTISKNITSAAIASVTTSHQFKGHTTNGGATVTAITSPIHLAPGQTITGTGIPSGTTISSISGTTLVMSQNATATGTPTITSNFNGSATVVTSTNHNLSAGEVIVITGNAFATTAGSTVQVDSVIDSNTFNFSTTITGSVTNAGSVQGSDGYAFNVATAVASIPSTTMYTFPSTINGSGKGGTCISSSIPDMLSTHTNPNWIWSDVTSGQTQVYFAGYVKTPLGAKYSGAVYRSNLGGSSTTAVSGLGTITGSNVVAPFSLNTPVQALPMAPDEYPVCIKSYLNFFFLGTNRGIRMMQTLNQYDPTATATGDLKSGPLIPNILQPVKQPVTAIVGDGRYVWFAWNNYDDQSTGLGKLDLQNYIAGDPLTPSYASDIMVNVVPGKTNIINSLEWDPYDNVPIMAIGGSGVYAPCATNEGGNPVVFKYVPTGNIVSGIFDYGIPDYKIPVFFDYGAIAPASKGTGIQAFIDIDPNDEDAAGYQVLPSYPQNGNTGISEFPVPNYHAEQFGVNLVLYSDAPNHGYTPILHRWTLKAWPAAVAGTAIMAVFQLHTVNLVDGLEVFTDPYDDFIWLENRRQNQEILTYQEGPLSVTCIIETIDWLPHKRRGNYDNGFEGDCIVTLKTISPYTYTPVQQLL